MSSTGKPQVPSLGGQIRLDQGNNRLVITKNTLNVMIAGLDNSGNVVVKIAKPGFDALVAADTNLAFNSAQNVFKIVGSGTISGTMPANTGFFSTTITHGLSYTPAVIAFLPVAGSNYLTTPYLQFDGTTGLNIEQTRVETDNTKVYLRMYAPNVSGNTLYSIGFTRQAKYYLLQESAT